jgi:hypothetical protein
MDDNTKKKKACKVDSSIDVDPDLEQDGELPHPFNTEDERVKKWILICGLLGICRPLDGLSCQAFIESESIPPGQICGTPGLCSFLPPLVTQSNSTSSITAMKLACKVNSNG